MELKNIFIRGTPKRKKIILEAEIDESELLNYPRSPGAAKLAFLLGTESLNATSYLKDFSREHEMIYYMIMQFEYQYFNKEIKDRKPENRIIFSKSVSPLVRH